MLPRGLIHSTGQFGFMSFLQKRGIITWLPNRHCERLKGARQSRKIIKKIL